VTLFQSDFLSAFTRVHRRPITVISHTSHNQPPTPPADTWDVFLEAHSKTFSNLSLHSQRLSRQFERTAAQLSELQETRRSRENGNSKTS
jgi:hypothetical protein